MLEHLIVERKLYNGVGKFKPEKVGNFTPELTNACNTAEFAFDFASNFSRIGFFPTIIYHPYHLV